MVLSTLLASSKYIIVNKDLIQILGLNEAILLGELCSEYTYWENTGQLEDNDYFYSTRENLQKNTGITPYFQRIALNNLENKGIIYTKKKGIPCKTYYRINENRIIECLKVAKNSVVNEMNIKQLTEITSSDKLKGYQDVNNFNINNNNINNNKEHTRSPPYFEEKICYADKVIMTKSEYKDLIDTYGEEKTQKLIKELNLYKLATGKSYDSDYAAIIRWVVTRINEIEKKNKEIGFKKPSGNFEQENYPPGFFDSLYSN